MKRIWVNPWFVVPVMAFYVVALALHFAVPYGDEILFFNDWRADLLGQFFRRVTHLGEAPAFVVAGLAALCWRFRFTLLIALVGVVTSPLVYTLKDRIGVDRPITYFDKGGRRDAVMLVPYEELNTGQTSFPSGHTMAAFGLYGILTLMLPAGAQRWGLAFAVMAILVGFSRIFLVQHFLSDVLAGALLGMMLAWAVWQFNQLPFMQRAAWLDKSILRL